MNLLDDIINLLSVKTGSLTDALLKTKVVLHKLGHPELDEWVNNELNGYEHEKDVPPYRVVTPRVRGNIGSVGWTHALTKRCQQSICLMCSGRAWRLINFHNQLLCLRNTLQRRRGH